MNNTHTYVRHTNYKNKHVPYLLLCSLGEIQSLVDPHKHAMVIRGQSTVYSRYVSDQKQKGQSKYDTCL